MTIAFDIIDYLSGLTGYVFDISVLKRVALDCGVASVQSYDELDEERRDRCKIALLETLVISPNQSASQTNKHGEYQTQVGSQTITEHTRETVKSELRRLYKRYNEEEKLAALNNSDATLEWIHEQVF